MRVLACVIAAAVLLVPSAGAVPRGLKLLVRDGSRLSLVYVDRATPFTQPLTPTTGVLAFSGDGRLVSIGGDVVSRGVRLPTRWLVWAPTGERAAYVTTQGGVAEWTPRGLRHVEPNGWGARWWWSPSVAWSSDGRLAVARGSELWVIDSGGKARRLLGPLAPTCCTGGPSLPIPAAWVGGHVLWWQWPGSGSVASDGVALWEDGKRLGTMLMDRDWLAACGGHVAFVSGVDRESMDDKKLVFDGRDVSGGGRRSWSTPSCTADGRLVASASRNLIPRLTYETHRAIWQVLPTRRQLTRPPWGWSDEDPRVFPNGDVLFVRTRARSRKTGTGWIDSQQGRVMLLTKGRLRELARIGFTQADNVYTYPVQFYGHYDWTSFLAVSS